MTSVNLNASSLPEAYAPAVSAKAVGFGGSSAPGSTAQTPEIPEDTVHLSPAAMREIALTGRVSLNEQAGNITTGQGTQLNGQISSIQTQIAADKQANGGTLSSSDAKAIQQLQNQLSQNVYSDAHNGAAAPTNPDVTRAGAREAVQAGRIALNETAGNLTSAQAGQLSSQISTTQQQIASDKQANGGSLSAADAKAINQTQNQLSRQIYDTAHSATSADSE
jgi:hypothetical protein